MVTITFEKAFFDPRFEAYSPEHYLGVYRKIRYGEPGWDKLVDKFDVQLFILKYTSLGEAKRQQGKPNVRQHLLAHPAWSLIAFDERGEVFVRRHGINGKQAKQFDLPCFDPDRSTFIARPASCATQLLALIERGFTDNHVLLAAAIAQADRGNITVAQKLVQEAMKQNPDDPHAALVHKRLKEVSQFPAPAASAGAATPQPSSPPPPAAATSASP